MRKRQHGQRTGLIGRKLNKRRMSELYSKTDGASDR
jgi:hypothetical protein